MENDNRKWFEKQWDDMLQKYVDYVELTGRYSCPKSINFELNRWIENQRRIYNSGNMSQYRSQRLIESGFKFNRWDAYFEESLSELEKYREIHGDLNVPVTYPVVGSIVQTIRSKYRKGLLRPDEIKRLEEIDFVFEYRDFKWMEEYYEVREYSDLNDGDFRNSGYNEWIQRQRKLYRLGKLSDKKIKLLSDIGIDVNFYQPRNK